MPLLPNQGESENLCYNAPSTANKHGAVMKITTTLMTTAIASLMTISCFAAPNLANSKPFKMFQRFANYQTHLIGTVSAVRFDENKYIPNARFMDVYTKNGRFFFSTSSRTVQAKTLNKFPRVGLTFLTKNTRSKQLACMVYGDAKLQSSIPFKTKTGVKATWDTYAVKPLTYKFAQRIRIRPISRKDYRIRGDQARYETIQDSFFFDINAKDGYRHVVKKAIYPA